MNLAETRLAGKLRMYDDDFNPEWELDPTDL